MALIDIKVPDIGDFAEVTVIEVLVKAGDTIKPEQSLITVESDKASMEIPSSHGGVVKALHVKLGDKVRQDSVVLTLESAAEEKLLLPLGEGRDGGDARETTPASAPTPTLPQRGREENAASSFAGTADLDCDVLVLGAGPGGYSAAFRAADLGLKVVLV